MKMLWLVLSINGSAEAYAPVGRVSMRACEEFAARQLMISPPALMSKVSYKCVTR
jgi:hypothetical protein